MVIDSDRTSKPLKSVKRLPFSDLTNLKNLNLNNDYSEKLDKLLKNEYSVHRKKSENYEPNKSPFKFKNEHAKEIFNNLTYNRIKKTPKRTIFGFRDDNKNTRNYKLINEDYFENMNQKVYDADQFRYSKSIDERSSIEDGFESSMLDFCDHFGTLNGDNDKSQEVDNLEKIQDKDHNSMTPTHHLGTKYACGKEKCAFTPEKSTKYKNKDASLTLQTAKTHERDVLKRKASPKFSENGTITRNDDKICFNSEELFFTNQCHVKMQNNLKDNKTDINNTKSSSTNTGISKKSSTRNFLKENFAQDLKTRYKKSPEKCSDSINANTKQKSNLSYRNNSEKNHKITPKSIKNQQKPIGKICGCSYMGRKDINSNLSHVNHDYLDNSYSKNYQNRLKKRTSIDNPHDSSLHDLLDQNNKNHATDGLFSRTKYNGLALYMGPQSSRKNTENLKEHLGNSHHSDSNNIVNSKSKDIQTSSQYSNISKAQNKNCDCTILHRKDLVVCKNADSCKSNLLNSVETPQNESLNYSYTTPVEVSHLCDKGSVVLREQNLKQEVTGSKNSMENAKCYLSAYSNDYQVCTNSSPSKYNEEEKLVRNHVETTRKTNRLSQSSFKNSKSNDQIDKIAFSRIESDYKSFKPKSPPYNHQNRPTKDRYIASKHMFCKDPQKQSQAQKEYEDKENIHPRTNHAQSCIKSKHINVYSRSEYDSTISSLSLPGNNPDSALALDAQTIYQSPVTSTVIQNPFTSLNKQKNYATTTNEDHAKKSVNHADSDYDKPENYFIYQPIIQKGNSLPIIPSNTSKARISIATDNDRLDPQKEEKYQKTIETLKKEIDALKSAYNILLGQKNASEDQLRKELEDHRCSNDQTNKAAIDAIEKKYAELTLLKDQNIKNMHGESQSTIQNYRAGCLDIIRRERAKYKNVILDLQAYYEELLIKYKMLLQGFKEKAKN